jgi:glutamate-ammonia-ligase adenylyltransferase
LDFGHWTLEYVGVQILDAKVESLVRDLPDEHGARLFLERLGTEEPQALQKLLRDPPLLADTLTLAAWSPLLATTLERNPTYFSWLARERADVRVRNRDQLKESLARFASTNSTLAPQVLFARFRRRELLRIYLHDIRRAHTLVETTEELSNLADAILEYAYNLARQELDNRFGQPLRDEGGRIATAQFCVVALGKLGSCELNYASDIDLLFLYSDEGMTGGTNEQVKLSNREYFVKLSEAISKLVGQPAGEGAAYRVDLRLRPHGRDGALACSFDEAVKYYRDTAQAWERQALIRSRAAVGSNSLFAKFAEVVESQIYRAAVSVKDALASVRLAKQKIDRSVERKHAGFNVKLQRGGIREIEFIAQALQLAHGAHDEWLRVSHTLISLGRLAERKLIFEQERSELSDAYLFLRTLEHRLQMEHGLQTHTVPQTESQLSLVAKRMGFAGERSVRDFNSALDEHTKNVRQAFDRVFANDETAGENATSPSAAIVETEEAAFADEYRLLDSAARVFTAHVRRDGELVAERELAQQMRLTATHAQNSHRAVMLTARVAASLEKFEHPLELSHANIDGVIRLCGASEFFGEMLASNPALLTSVTSANLRLRRKDLRAQLRAAVDPERSFAAELAALRTEWSRLLLEIGAEDASGNLSLAASNELQTELAVASINVAFLIARRELVRRHGPLAAGPRLSVLALGRLASGGVDYGSDLDIVIVYDPLVTSPVAGLTQPEAYAHLCELMVAALSSVTREGYLYRIDLRLRPNGKNGPLVISSESFVDYVKHQSAIWEWLAYVKLRAVAGDLELGKMVETHARHALHEKAVAIDGAELKEETRRVRERLELEKGKPRAGNGRHVRRARAREIDIKYSAGGMLDVYFATRYLQLRDDVPDEGENRSTLKTLRRLESNGSLANEDYEALSAGYELLRAVDHQLRLIVGKMAVLPSTDYHMFQEIAERLKFATPEALREALRERMSAIRVAYDRITA